MKAARVFLFATLAIALGWIVSGQMGSVSASAKVPRIVADDSVVGKTADVATISSVTVPSGGANYRVTTLFAFTAGTGIAGQINVSWTDDVGSQTASLNMVQSAGLPVTTGTFAIHAASGTVAVSTSCTQGPCNPNGAHTYNVYSIIEEL